LNEAHGYGNFSNILFPFQRPKRTRRFVTRFYKYSYKTLCEIVVWISRDRRISLRERPSYEMSRCAVWQKCTDVSVDPVSIIHPHDRGIRFLWSVGTLLPGCTA
jgi:hypothetical protein